MSKKEKISGVDKKIWDEYTQNPKDIYDKDLNSTEKKNISKRLKFDLHGFNLEDANRKIENLINKCLEKRCYEILLITGKGIHSNTEKNVYVSSDLSKLRYSIPDFIFSNEKLSSKVDSVSPASLEEGGEGALIIKIKKL